MDTVINRVKNIPGYENATVILDVLSNVAFRFEQDEGDTYLPIKISGSYHMAGKIVPSSREQLHSHLRKLQPLLEVLRGEKVFLNPLPRYLYTPCCELPDHCVGLDSDTHAESIVGDTVAIRKMVRDYLHCRVSRVWVPDMLTALAPGRTGCADIAVGLKNLFAKDGVHLTPGGYELYGSNLHNIVTSKLSASVCVSGGVPGQGTPNKSFYWKGFVSPVGSSRPSSAASFHGNRSAVKGRHSGYHPYRKK